MKLQNKYNLVLISGQYKFLHKRLILISDALHIKIQKVKQCHVYFEIESDLDLKETIRQVKIGIYQDRRTWEMHYQIYSFYNNKIDFLSYVSEDKKKLMKYYQ